MSRNSKAKRDQRRKKQPLRPFARLGREQAVVNHAVLQDAEGHVVAAIGQQAGGQWLLGIGGQTMGSADTPVAMLAMLKHLANLQEQEGRAVTLNYSGPLQQILDDLAADQGKSADDYLTQLAAEFADEQAGAADSAENATETEAEAEAETSQSPAVQDAKPAP